MVSYRSKSYLRPNFECIQSWVTAYVDEGDATLAFMESSNIYHEVFAQKFEHMC